MKRGIMFKLFRILFIIAVSVILILPTVGEKTMEVTLKTDATQEQITQIKKYFPEENYSIEKKEKNTIIIKGYRLSTAKTNEALSLDFVKDAELLPHWAEGIGKKVNLGLDLQGGMQVVLQADYEKMEQKKGVKFTEEEKLEITAQALEKINNRIDSFGVSEPSVRPKGVEAIEIQLPGVRKPEEVKKALKKTGRIEYRIVDENFDKSISAYFKENKIEIPDSEEKQKELTDKIAKENKLPNNLEILFFYDRDINTGKIFPKYPMVLEKKAALSGGDIAKAHETRDEYGKLAVGFETTDDGAVKFADVTSKKNHGKRMAIVIDDNIRSAPSIGVQITTGKAIITGNFSYDEVKILSRIIQEGALPVDLKIIEERTVGPSLGQDSIESGVVAIIIGLILIMIFMIAYYKIAGIIADFCLLLNMMFMLALLSLLGFTLTLPGIAGFILTVGMSVDANVIIYERIKEEQKNGKSARTAVLNGFERAFWTIFDANLTTIIAAFILAQFGTGPIKGFAVTLIIGIICSMFVSLYISKFIYEMITSNKNIKKLSI